MNSRKYIGYVRVSTERQGASGLGIEAQLESVRRYTRQQNGELVTVYTEVETGKGVNALEKRPVLKEALEHCKDIGATLIVAKLDRLARSVAFIANLMESGASFVACDNPTANELTVHILAAVAQAEVRAISTRTKEALERAKARGVKLGSPIGWNNVNGLRVKDANAFAETIRPVITKFYNDGLSLKAIASELNNKGVKTSTGKEWSKLQVKRVVERLGL